ncbi:hypothetical protein VPHD246_0089 [Vibrio phage D246]
MVERPGFAHGVSTTVPYCCYTISLLFGGAMGDRTPLRKVQASFRTHN